MRQKLVMSMLGVAMCMSIAMPVFAEAPVFDADTMQQDDQLPMPPAPGQEAAMDGPPPSLGPAPVPIAAAPTTSSTAQRLQRLEQQLANLQENGSAPRVESLQKEVQGLRSQVEQLTHQLQQTQTQQKTMYTDLDKRVSSSKPVAPDAMTADVGASNTTDAAPVVKTDKVASAKPAAKTLASDMIVATTAKTATTPTVAAAGANDPQPNVAEEQQIYQTAYNFIKAKKYNEAINALQGMLQKYPAGQFASNAHYWLGELYGLVGKNDQALSEFTIVVKTYSSSPRVSDAQLKIGLLYAAQIKWADAKAAFKKVINRYPGTSSAKLAALQLKQIKEAGH